MATYSTPGVFYETVDASGATITSLRTDIAGFVGIAERGPIDVPVPVESWRQFQAHFGDMTGAGYLAYVVRAFLENGGRRCWVVRVASRLPGAGASSASAMVRRGAGKPDVWRIRASSPGTWGNRLTVQIRETHRAQATADIAASTETYTQVSRTSGFGRATLVRIVQPSAPPIYRVINDVDSVERRVIWTTDRRERRLPYDAPLTGLSASQAAIIESVELDMIVMDGGMAVATYRGLSVIPEHARYGPRALAAYASPIDVENERTVERARSGGRPTTPRAPLHVTVDELRASYLSPQASIVVTDDDLPASATVRLEGGIDGLRLLTPRDFTGEEWSAEDSDEVKQGRRRGFRALGEIDEIAIVAVPDIHVHAVAPPDHAPPPPCLPDPCDPCCACEPTPTSPLAADGDLPPIFDEEDVYRVQADLVQHCEGRRDRFAILDSPYQVAHSAALGSAGIRAWRQRFDSNMAALHHPWISVVDPLRSGGAPTRSIPPSGHVAGQLARTDLADGPHRAAANAVLTWAQDVTLPINDEIHGVLNALGVNAIRALPGRGLRVMGARTVSSDPSWRYVPVRRFILMVMKAIDVATQWAVFEPNTVETRERIRLSLTVYLATVWQRGQLAGASAEEAFFVKCDGENNTPDDAANGRLIVDVGVAPAIPFEFVVVRVWRAGNELEIAESPAPFAAMGGVS